MVYGDRDILYLSIHALHKIAKFNGKDGAVPKLYKLGSAAWKKLKSKTKKKVKQIAFDLIELYAKRRMQKGFAFGPDSYLQHELESSFLYEDTQIKPKQPMRLNRTWNVRSPWIDWSAAMWALEKPKWPSRGLQSSRQWQTGRGAGPNNDFSLSAF